MVYLNARLLSLIGLYILRHIECDGTKPYGAYFTKKKKKNVIASTISLRNMNIDTSTGQVKKHHLPCIHVFIKMFAWTRLWIDAIWPLPQLTTENKQLCCGDSHLWCSFPNEKLYNYSFKMTRDFLCSQCPEDLICHPIYRLLLLSVLVLYCAPLGIMFFFCLVCARIIKTVTSRSTSVISLFGPLHLGPAPNYS